MPSELDMIDRPIYGKEVSDPETSPEAIWERQKKEVAHMLRHDFDEATISATLTLPLWSVRRAVCEITTGKPWKFPTAKELLKRASSKPRKTRNQNPGRYPLFTPLPEENPCPKNKPSQKSPESPEKLPRKRPPSRSGTSAASTANSRKAKKSAGGRRSVA